VADAGGTQQEGDAVVADVRKRGLYLGVVPEQAAARNGSTSLTLDHDLDILPGVGRCMTVADLAGHVDDLAGRLWAAGIRPGERVAVYKAENFDLCLLCMAVARTGAIPVTLSHHLPPATVGGLLARLDQPYLLTDAGKIDALAGVPLADLTTRVISGTEPRPGAVPLAELAGAPRIRPVCQGLDEPALITHTSGTTGLPKLVVHTPRTQRTRLRPQLVLLTLMRKPETVAIRMPFGHSRNFAALSICLSKGMPLLLVNNPDPEAVAGFFVKYRPGLIEALPNSFMAWEGLADDPRKPLASVKIFSSTFDAIHPRTISRLLEASERRSPLFFQIYGQTEVGPAIARPYFRRFARAKEDRCVGYPMLGGPRVRVVQRDGNPVSETTPGYIEVRWDGLAQTYLGEQERFDEAKDGSWRKTGDVGYRTRLGCLHMLDREVDMIPGVQSSLKIEDVVMSRMAELSELVVVPGPKSEPVPVVCTDEDQPLDRDRWRAATADFPQLADPVQIPLAELPRTATLKVRRIELSRLLQDQMTKQA
jgi:acyl-coenzyme A synthetase/AMP-(fatty) acid ligase